MNFNLTNLIIILFNEIEFNQGNQYQRGGNNMYRGRGGPMQRGGSGGPQQQQPNQYRPRRPQNNGRGYRKNNLSQEQVNCVLFKF